MFRKIRRNYKYAFPSGEGGSRRLTDEEIGVCTALKTGLLPQYIKTY